MLFFLFYFGAQDEAKFGFKQFWVQAGAATAEFAVVGVVGLVFVATSDSSAEQACWYTKLWMGHEDALGGNLTPPTLTKSHIGRHDKTASCGV